MLIDRVVEETIKKKNPCIVGLDPEWNLIPKCYKEKARSKAEVILEWAKDIIDAVHDIVIAVKPQMAFYEIYGPEGFHTFQQIVEYAHHKNLIVIDDSKRNDIGNTAKAYAYAHLAKEGPINADFLTVSPFLGMDSIQPFVDVAVSDEKGIFVLVKTSNPGSVEISEATNADGEKIRNWLADYIKRIGNVCVGKSGYSLIGAVVGATFPQEATELRERMRNNYFLVPGFGVQGGSANDIVKCFNQDGLGALISSSRGILYKYIDRKDYDGSRNMYKEIVRSQAVQMQQDVYAVLKENCKKMRY